MTRLRAIEADITDLEVDAIVNAANSGLQGGSGVDGAIHFRGGPEILAECKQIVANWGYLPVGDAVFTTAGMLPANLVIHTVGPRWTGDTERHDRDLASCYTSSLELADQQRCTTVAFPCISAGLYGFPPDRAAHVAVGAVRGWIASHEDAGIDEVTFACFSADDLAHYRAQGIGG